MEGVLPRLRVRRRRRRPPWALVAVLLFAWGFAGIGVMFLALALKTAPPLWWLAFCVLMTLSLWSFVGYVIWHVRRYFELWINDPRPPNGLMIFASRLVAVQGTLLAVVALALPPVHG